jgi:catechol 2,3-dioxygenase-like lactoylglutathione lyase family enzyme
MSEDNKPRLVGINHIALEVGDVQEALAFYRRIFSFELRGQGEDNPAPASPDRPLRREPHRAPSFQLFQARRLCVKLTGTCSRVP